jgi:vanillate O-demethylase monooxygenase subunit
MSHSCNQWYVAGFDDELKSGELLARTYLGENDLLFRTKDGAPRALADRRPHRFAPLSAGKLQVAALQCGHHGLAFDGSGACVHNPHGTIPKAACVRAYSVAERHRLLWIWMGEAALADAALIPDFGFNDPEHWAVSTGTMVVDAPYELEVDNILDLSHIEFMHPLFGSEAVRRAEVKCEQDGDVVWCKRFMADDREVPDFLRQAFQVTEGLLAGDAAAVRARRLLRGAIEKELG